MTNLEQINREKSYWTNYGHYAWLSEKGRREVLKLLPAVNGDVLELCSGSGMFARHLQANCRSYTCLDISANMLSALKKDLPNIITLEGNAEEPELPANSFDLVLVFAGLHHLSNIEKAVVNARRLLREGGCFIALEPNNSCWYRQFMMPMKNILKLYTEDEAFINPDDLQRIMEAARFKEIRTDYLTPEYNPGCLNHVSKFLELLMKVTAQLDQGKLNQSFFLMMGKK